MDDLVMRSVYLPPLEDSQLRQLAHDNHVSKSDLIRSAISAKLKEWLEEDGGKMMVEDLKLGRRDANARNSAEPQSLSPKAVAAEREARVRPAGKERKGTEAVAGNKSNNERV